MGGVMNRHMCVCVRVCVNASVCGGGAAGRPWIDLTSVTLMAFVFCMSPKKSAADVPTPTPTQTHTPPHCD